MAEEKKEATEAQKSFMDKYGIWLFAFGYFAAYWPYSAITKLVTDNKLPETLANDHWLRGICQGLPGPEVLPLSVFASVIGAYLFLTFRGLWGYAKYYKVGPLNVPGPDLPTLGSGLCSSLIIVTTTLAYTFTGVSIIFIMLLMRGGLLLLTPVIDMLNKRTVRWFSWIGMILSLVSLIVTFLMKNHGKTFDFLGAFGNTPEAQGACITNLCVYLSAYFGRLSLMSKKAKSKDPETNTRYFVREQLVSSPSLFIMVLILAIIGGFTPDWKFGQELHAGITTIFTNFTPIVPIMVFLIGVFSAGNGIFGGLILLDKNENTYTVPVNRCSSIIAGLLATATVTFLTTGNISVKPEEAVGAGIIIFAIFFLTIPLFFKTKPAEAKPATEEKKEEVKSEGQEKEITEEEK